MPYDKITSKLEWDIHPIRCANLTLGFYDKRAVVKIVYGSKTKRYYAYMKSNGKYHKFSDTFDTEEKAKIFCAKIFN